MGEGELAISFTCCSVSVSRIKYTIVGIWS